MDGIITFITITLLIIIVPGPDFLIVMKNTIHSGKLNGSMAALGITSAHIIYSSLAVLGIIYYKFILRIFDYKNTRCMLSDLSWRTKYSFSSSVDEL